MNQEKVGKFISKLRKDKGMTQEVLAEKMGVSINAVSKWERGLSFPDVSLYKKLCKELDISIEELINGEKDSSEEAKEKAIFSTIEESNKIKKKSNMKIIFLIVLFAIIVLGIFIYNNNLKVNLITDSDNLYDISIEYLKKEEFTKNQDSKQKDFNVFYSYHPFGIEKKDRYIYVYMWIYNQSYYLEETDALAISSGKSMPCKITFKDNIFIKAEYPKEGNKYVSSVKKMFPGIIAIQVLSFDKEKNINKLFDEVENKKNIYYDYLNLDMSKLELDDISYGDLIFVVNIGRRNCIPIQLSVYKNNKYILHTAYKACRVGRVCTSELRYTKFIEGTYNYDIIQIIKHSIDANHLQFNNNNLPEYEIFSGNGHQFVTDNNNKYLMEFLKSININLNKCATPDYID